MSYNRNSDEVLGKKLEVYEERMHKLRDGSEAAKWAADRIAELEAQLKEQSDTWQRVINTQYVPRIERLDAQLKTAKRDAILEAVVANTRHGVFAKNWYCRADDLINYANTI